MNFFLTERQHLKRLKIKYKIKKVEIDSSFPKYIFKNKEKLKKWIA